MNIAAVTFATAAMFILAFAGNSEVRHQQATIKRPERESSDSLDWATGSVALRRATAKLAVGRIAAVAIRLLAGRSRGRACRSCHDPATRG
jgi:hypothetical protein